ncbi:MAG: TPM domain-containing protein [Erysipelotrichaceae bacterium]|nr:TPM domain-containing protein [Erysipelotrichaceae bacterium]
MKRFLTILCVLFCSLLLTANVSAKTRLFYDEVDLVNDYEEEVLNSELEAYSKKYGIDIVVVYTAEDIGYKEARVAAADYYDYGGFSKEGLILYVNFYTRDYAIVSSGDIQDRELNARAIDYLLDNYVGTYLSNGQYSAAVEDLLSGVDYVFNNSNKFSEQSVIKTKIMTILGSSTVIAGIAGLIKKGSLKSQLKSERKQENAHEYINPSDFRVFRSGDIKLYNTVSRVKISSSKSSSGGSSGSFKSSSGVRHTGGSRKF